MNKITIMKNVNIFFCFFIFICSYAQYETVKVEVTEKKDFTTKMNETTKANAASMAAGAAAANARANATAARAATSAAMNSANVEEKVPITVDLYNYSSIAIVNSTYSNATGAQSSNKRTYSDLASSLANSPLTIINPVDYDKKRFKKNTRFLRDIKNPEWLYLYYVKSMVGVNEVRSIVVRDHKNKVIYNATTTNVPFSETLSPIVNF